MGWSRVVRLGKSCFCYLPMFCLLLSVMAIRFCMPTTRSLSTRMLLPMLATSVLEWSTRSKLFWIGLRKIVWKLIPQRDLLVVKAKRLPFEETFKIRFGSQLIEPSPSVKVLGIIVDSGLTWEPQISFIVRRCYGRSREAEPQTTIRNQKSHYRRTRMSIHYLLPNTLGRVQQN